MPKGKRKTSKRKPSTRRTPKKSAQQAAPVSLRGLARELGCSPRAVEKAVKTGRLEGTYSRKGKGPFQFDLAAAMEAWVRNATQPTKIGDPADLVDQLDLDGPIPEYAESKRRLEYWKAQNEKLKYLESAGALVSASVTRREAAAVGAAIREGFAFLPGKLREVLAALTKPAKVEARLKKEINMILEELGDSGGKA